MDDRPGRSGSWQALLAFGLAAAVGALSLGTLGGTALSSVVPVAVAPSSPTELAAPSAEPGPAVPPGPAAVPSPAAPSPASSPVAEPVGPHADLRDASRPLAGLVVALDPGHNRDNGTHEQTRRPVDAGGLVKDCNTTGTSTSDGYTESRFNAELAERLAARLRLLGALVHLTRDGDRGWGPCVDERGRFGAASGAHLMLSLHADGSTTAGDRGFHVIRPGRLRGWTDDVEEPSARLAETVRDRLVAAGFAPSNYRGIDGVDVRTDLGTLNWADVPTVVVESHNMRDPQEAALFRTPEGQARFAAALAEAVQVVGPELALRPAG